MTKQENRYGQENLPSTKHLIFGQNSHPAIAGKIQAILLYLCQEISLTQACLKVGTQVFSLPTQENHDSNQCDQSLNKEPR